MTTTQTGRQAEQAAAEGLERLCYEILDRNWRTRVCEIDIIKQKANLAAIEVCAPDYTISEFIESIE